MLNITQIVQSVKSQLLYDKEEQYKAKICDIRFTSLNQGDNAKINDAIAMNNDNKDKVEDTREKAGNLRKKSNT